jgi:spore germination cell wall hydrolase CwlJ-like protein
MISAVFCLSMAIYFEARSEPLTGQMAVADVIMNKANWNPKRVCKTTFKDAYITSLQTTKSIPKQTDKSWQVAQQIAKLVIQAGEDADVSNGSNHFYKLNTHPYWEPSCEMRYQFGRHIFCYEDLNE